MERFWLLTNVMVRTRTLRLDLLSMPLTSQTLKLTLQSHLQIGSNNFTLTWPVTLHMTRGSTFFVDEVSRAIDCLFRLWDRFSSFGGIWELKMPPSGWRVGRTLSGRQDAPIFFARGAGMRHRKCAWCGGGGDLAPRQCWEKRKHVLERYTFSRSSKIEELKIWNTKFWYSSFVDEAVPSRLMYFENCSSGLLDFGLALKFVTYQ